MEIGSIGEDVADVAERTGLRAYIADGYRSGRWLSDDGRSVRYEWDEAQGMRDFERAVALVERLRERTILGHALMTAGHSWVQFSGDDLTLLAESGAAVAHCPWVFARRGGMMESFADYVARGIDCRFGASGRPSFARRIGGERRLEATDAALRRRLATVRSASPSR